MYGQLPSTIRDCATTYDLSVANAMISWENKQMAKAAGAPDVPALSQEEMMEMIKRAKES